MEGDEVPGGRLERSRKSSSAFKPTTPCLKKNDNDVAHYNFNAH